VDCAGCRDVLLLTPTHCVRPTKRGEVFAAEAKERGWRWLSGPDRWGWHCPCCKSGEENHERHEDGSDI
jgi:hypothetical protein